MEREIVMLEDWGKQLGAGSILYGGREIVQKDGVGTIQGELKWEYGIIQRVEGKTKGDLGVLWEGFYEMVRGCVEGEKSVGVSTFYGDFWNVPYFCSYKKICRLFLFLRLPIGNNIVKLE